MIFGSTGSKMKKAMGPPRLNIRQERPPSCEMRSEEHTSELQSQSNLVCRLLLEKKKKTHKPDTKLLKTKVLLMPNYYPYSPRIRDLLYLITFTHYHAETLPKLNDTPIDLHPDCH